MSDVEQFAKGIPPWAYAAMARDCLIFSDERRTKAVDERALRYMRNLFMEAYEGPQSGRPTLFSLVVGHLYEQTWYQTSVEHDIARTYLLLTAPIPDGQHVHPDESDWEELLGAPLREAIAASFILYAATIGAGGRFNPNQLNDPSYQEISELAKVDDTRAVMRLLTTTVADAREAGRRGPQLPESLQRFSYNPLVRTPLVDLGDRYLYGPQPQFILRAMSTENLYYRGIERWGESNFGEAFGARVEAYTGMQLRHTGQHVVIPEFQWRKNRAGVMRSSDWFLITPQVTILIECKSARMTFAAKAGSEQTADGILERYIGRAYDQLSKNAAEILGGNAQFEHIPSDRPLVGLVVTAEPIFSANDLAVRERFQDPGIPVLTLSLFEVELLAALPPDAVGETILTIVNDPELSTWHLSQSIMKVLGTDQLPANTLIDETADAILPLADG